MNILLIFFAIPVATVILAGILETFIKCPLKVAGIFFSIFLVVAFALGGTVELLVAAIIYTLLAFITAYIVMVIRNRNCNCGNNCNSYCRNSCNENCSCRNNDFNNFNSTPFSFNDENIIVNSLPENDNRALNINNNSNNGCRSYR